MERMLGGKARVRGGKRVVERKRKRRECAEGAVRGGGREEEEEEEEEETTRKGRRERGGANEDGRKDPSDPSFCGGGVELSWLAARSGPRGLGGGSSS